MPRGNSQSVQNYYSNYAPAKSSGSNVQVRQSESTVVRPPTYGRNAGATTSKQSVSTTTRESGSSTTRYTQTVTTRNDSATITRQQTMTVTQPAPSSSYYGQLKYK